MEYFAKVQEVRKAIVNVIALASALCAQGFLPEPWNSYAAAAIATVAIIVHYEVPNAPQTPKDV